ncbi:MAG: endo-1,4-beta-xylanase xyn5A [Bacteroidaceae bacterium]|nr:endo-1,4-beta-xylanase xyn5A [Bacteroidaceae bacterium]
MNRFTFSIFSLMAATSIDAMTHIVRVRNTPCQTITGFGAACCDGAMKPFGEDVVPVKLLYGPTSKVGLNIMRMEISPNLEDKADQGGDYDWNGSLPSAKIVKQYGGIVFGTPWSPPGEYKTNGTAQGGNSDSQGNKRGKLRTDCYEKFFPWLNSFLKWMKNHGVKVDAVSIQNEPDWWVNYSGCLYDPQDLVKLVKNYAYMLDRETYPGVRLISGESLGFTKEYTDPLMKDEECRKHIDIVAGHLYGHAPLQYMKESAVLPLKYGKEVWMTEHSVSDGIKNRLPNWSEQLEFARELNECMLAGCTGYIYWYMRAHWAFVGTGEAEYGTGNKKNKLLPRGWVMSHFSKHVTGSTRVETKATFTTSTNSELETSAYIKGDSIIIMAINSSKTNHDLRIQLPAYVKSGVHILSTGNETEKLCQEEPFTIETPLNDYTASMPAYSVNTYIFMIDREVTIIDNLLSAEDDDTKTYYDLQGRPLQTPHGVCIEKSADGFTRKVYIKD